MIKGNTYSEAVMVDYDEGLYGHRPFDEIEEWRAVFDAVDSVEPLGELKGWGDWTHSVRVFQGPDSWVYFVK